MNYRTIVNGYVKLEQNDINFLLTEEGKKFHDKVCIKTSELSKLRKLLLKEGSQFNKTIKNIEEILKEKNISFD